MTNVVRPKRIENFTLILTIAASQVEKVEPSG